MKKQQALSIGLSIIYLVALTSVILFKFPFKGDDFGTTRAIELIPFYVSEIQDLYFFRSNLIYNFLLFVPVGMYVCLLKPDWHFAKKIIPVAAISLTYEVLQFILGIGISDTTDLITNTLGGATGIALFWLAQKIFKEKTQVVANAVALVFTVAMAVAFAAAWKLMIR